jgi:flagellar hook-associated protein 3 FlgL
MRVTTAAASRHALQNLQAALGDVQNLQNQLSSGKAIQRPSDDPSGALVAMRNRSEIRRQDQYGRNAEDGLGWLATTDTALTSASDLMRRARDLTLQGANGSLSSTDRSALAVEVENLRDALVQTANTTYLDRPVFAGTENVLVAFRQTGGTVSYEGNDGTSSRTVAPDTRVPVNVTGASAFGANGSSVFDALTTIAAHLRGDDTAALSTSDLTALDGHRTRIQDTLSSVGARYNRIESLRTQAGTLGDDLRVRLSDVEDVDLPKTIMELQLRQTAYQAALATSAKVLQPSLVDFLR